jgi:hypothetical protein
VISPAKAAVELIPTKMAHTASAIDALRMSPPCRSGSLDRRTYRRRALGSNGGQRLPYDPEAAVDARSQIEPSRATGGHHEQGERPSPLGTDRTRVAKRRPSGVVGPKSERPKATESGRVAPSVAARLSDDVVLGGKRYSCQVLPRLH